MIIHKMIDRIDRMEDTTIGGICLFFLWCITTTLISLPLIGVINGWTNKNANATITLIIGCILGLAAVILSVSWLYYMEARFDRKRKAAETHRNHEAMTRRTHVRQMERELELEPYPYEDDVDEKLKVSRRVGRVAWTEAEYINPYTVINSINSNQAMLRARAQQQQAIQSFR